MELFQSVVEFIRTSFGTPHSSLQSQDGTVLLIWGCSCLWGLLPIPEAAGRSNVPARLFKGHILGMFWDELSGTGTWLCLVSITLVWPVSADAWKQLWTSACLDDLGNLRWIYRPEASTWLNGYCVCARDLLREVRLSSSVSVSGVRFLIRENNLNSYGWVINVSIALHLHM